jgi:hypothetical protein
VRGGTELLPDGMYLALERIMRLIVERYDELSASAGGRLAKETLRRSIEDDYPLRLVMPPREHYTVEAISPAPRKADLRIDGELERIGEDR